MRRGLTEWAVVTAALALAAAAGSLRFGGEIRAAFGLPRAPGAAVAPGPGLTYPRAPWLPR